jgi:hypothetical protein
VADIKGTDKADEFVVMGPIWIPGTWQPAPRITAQGGRRDGSHANFEGFGLTMRRTVRLGLWTGEEEGIRAHVRSWTNIF